MSSTNKSRKTQLQGGYLLDCVKTSLLEDVGPQRAMELVTSLCYFAVDGVGDTQSVKDLNHCPEHAVLHNQILRGLPTRPSLFVEESIIKALDLGNTFTNSLGTIETKTNSNYDAIRPHLFRSLHIIDPRIRSEDIEVGLEASFEYDSIGSTYEESFLHIHAPKHLGPEWFQILEPQRELNSIVPPAHTESQFVRQRVDFAVELPYHERYKGIIVEIDGPDHSQEEQRILDARRDREAENAGWCPTMRLDVENFGEIRSQIQRDTVTFCQEPYLQVLKENYASPLYERPCGLKALQLTLSPIAIARLQRVLVQLLLEGKLPLTSPSWKIAVIEHDIPCAALAIVDMISKLKGLFTLQGKSFSPTVELTIFTTKEFQNAELNNIDYSNHYSKIEFKDIAEIEKSEGFDILFDISMLQRQDFHKYSTNHGKNFKEVCIIRSSDHKSSQRSFLTSEIIEYSEILQKVQDNILLYRYKQKRELALESFLQDIFRKKKFKEGQLEILNLALQGKSVIGLLPTGGGKSLTYQLASILQPGICLVVDPLVSLMIDQYDSLINNQIDACRYINGTLNTQQKTQAISELNQGKILICFITPERLQIKEFRSALSHLKNNKIYFSYCVIDEAHCVSEWGHDFRTSYLNIGKNAIKYCKAKNNKEIPLIGLTATASFDVLTDIQRELSNIESNKRLAEDSIVYLENIHREELTFEVISVTAGLKSNDAEPVIRKRVGIAKREALNHILASMEFDEDNDYSGIVFCPHRTGYFGVTNRHSNNSIPGTADIISCANHNNIRVGTFMGRGLESTIGDDIVEESLMNQNEFINNNLNLLVATNAFGMGIDKPNVRFTCHINYPNSIESFIQEAGRAGRDRSPARCIILFNEETGGSEGKELDREIQLYFYNAAFRGVERENNIIKHMMSTMTAQSNLRKMELDIQSQFNEEIELEIFEEAGRNAFVYVSGQNPNIRGRVWVSTLQNENHSPNPPPNQEEILNFIANQLGHCPEHNLLSWLIRPTIGLETALIESNHTEMAIPWDNNTSTDISRLLTSCSEREINPQDIHSYLRNSESFDDFIRRLEGSQGLKKLEEALNNHDFNQTLPTRHSINNLKRLFEAFRTKEDTEKALYRLMTLGVIEDYTVDFNSKTFTIEAIHKAEEEYLENLKNYIGNYYSEQRTTQEIVTAQSSTNNISTIQRYLYFLTDFVYREIATKRRRKIDVMREACRIGVVGGNEAFKDFVRYYFGSKYARRSYEIFRNGTWINKSLLDKTDYGKNQSINWVWEFIDVIEEDESGSHINNLKHLNGACTRMLTSQPSNGTLLLLKAFALLILEPENQILREEIMECLKNGFKSFKEDENLLETFKDKLEIHTSNKCVQTTIEDAWQLAEAELKSEAEQPKT